MKLIIKPFFLFLFIIISNKSYSQSGMWTWMGGDTINYQGCITCGVYGTKGIPDPSNVLPPLYSPLSWTDKHNRFWLYGGIVSSNEMMNNMWMYDPAVNLWTWIAGDSTVRNSKSNHAIQGVASPLNTPGCRAYGSGTWVDTSGNFWLFGGDTYDDNNQYKPMNDLWKYDVDSNLWTWVKGSPLGYSLGHLGTIGVPDTANNPRSDDEIGACWVDDNNNLWFYGGKNGSILWRFNMTTNEWTYMKPTFPTWSGVIRGVKGVPDTSNNPGRRIVYAHWKDDSGNFWLWGGADDLAYDSTYNDLWKYNITSNQWTWVSGSASKNPAQIDNGFCNQDTANQPEGEYENRMCWKDSQGKFWMFSGLNSTGNHNSDPIWSYNPATNQWAHVKGRANSPYDYNLNARYGSIGVPDTNNSPGGRFGTAAWQDTSGSVWMFGGYSYHRGTAGGNPIPYLKADLWKFTPDSCVVMVYVDEYGETAQSIEISQMNGSSLIKIQMKDAAEQINKIEVYDLQGRNIFSGDVKNDFAFDMEGRSKGIYMCRFNFKSGRQVVKKFSFN